MPPPAESSRAVRRKELLVSAGGARKEEGDTMKKCTKIRIAAAGVLALAIVLLSIKSDKRTKNRRI